MGANKKIPCEKTIDNSLSLLLEGYSFIQNRCHKYKTDIFQTRLLGQKAICMSGEEAAKVFYDNDYFIRKDVAPKRVQKTLTGQNGVQGLDGEEHTNRKQMFMSIMTPENLKLLIDYTTEQWETNSLKWNNKNIALFEEAQIIMCQIACKWAGVPLQNNEIQQRASDLGKMIDGFGAVGIRYWQGRCAPQGGGDCSKGHRCAGELVTIEIMKASLDFIANHLTYKVYKQNLGYRLSRIPTLPKSKFIMSKVRRI